MGLFKAQSYYACSAKTSQEDQCRDLVKLNRSAGLGTCLPEGPPENISELLRRNNIHPHMGNNPQARDEATNLTPLTDTNNPRLVALARVVEAFDQIGDGSFSALRDGGKIDVVFANSQSGATNSRRYGPQVQLTGGNQNMIGTGHASTCAGVDNHGLIAHELGHYVAGNNNERVMKRYLNHMGHKKCDLTTYSKKNRSEEFAEVIAAYITLPQKFSDPSPDCLHALEFMKTLFGEPNFVKTCDGRRNSYRNGR